MLTYILKRLLLMIPTILGVLTLTFIVIQFVPGGPVETLLAEARAGSGGDQASFQARRDLDAKQVAELKALYEFEPGDDQILADLLPKNLSIQVYRALLESAASEQGARMTAMDSATRNAGEMINKLTLVYNRTRQAVITKELIEIISGAEAL